MRTTIAHSARGRLRVRYPAHWLKGRWSAIESRLKGIPGVRAVEGRPLTGSILIDYNPYRLAEAAILSALDVMTEELVSPVRTRSKAAPRPRQRLPSAPLLKMIGTTTVLASVCCLPVSSAVAAGLIVVSGLPTFLRAGSALVARRRVNGDVLEASTLGLLVVRGNYAAAALLTWLRSLGEFVVARSIVTTRKSLSDLVAEPDRTVLKQVGERREAVRVPSLQVGDVIVVSADQRLPADGTVVGGEALVNQQTMTGEALPVERRPGDRVFAATTVEYGEIEVRVERLGFDTAVGRIVRAVEAATEEKPDIQVFAERLADRGVGRTLALAGMGTVFSRSLNSGLAILVADYGTAARVGIPTVLMAFLKRAVSEGILFKGPRALEDLARVNTVVFDKTGTLTSGVPHVARVVTYQRALDEDEIIRLAAAAERGLRHPIARAIARLAKERGVAVPEAAQTEPSVGLGVDVRVEDHRVLVGSRRFLESRNVPLEAAAGDEAAAHAVGASPIFVAIDGRLAGMLVLQDRLRDDAPDAVRALRARQMRNVIMLSGDHPEPTRVIAESLGLRHYRAQLLPEDKARLIRELKAEGRVVAMVGDGVNDALALNEADVGIAVPGGADVATVAADIIVLAGGLDRVVRAVDLARESVSAVRRTLGIAARANLGVVGLASLGWARPLPSILMSHGTTVVAALLTATRGAASPVKPAVTSAG